MTHTEYSTTHLNADQFESILRTARPGETVLYHRGFLLDDRDRSDLVKDIGKRAWALYEKGWCLLFQRRNSSGADYLAIRIRRAA